MSEITITVDGQELQVASDELLIQVLNRHHFDVPQFCYHDALGMDGNCRMCMVEIEGQKRPQIACDTFPKEGMQVRTRGESIDAVRQKILELELINHPVDCPICDQAGECKLQDYYMDYGLYDSHIEKSQKVHQRKHIDLGSEVMLDQERCVLCARCTRFTSNITKTSELGIVGRGDHARVATMPGKKLDNSYAMNVVDLCPVGALTSKDFRFKQRVWFLTSTPSVCHGCAKGCNIFIDHNREKYKDDTVYRFRPRKNLEVNGHFICDEGRLSYKALQDSRQLEALYRSEPVTRGVATRALQELVAMKHEQIVILASADLYSEELKALMGLAMRMDAQLICPMESYLDEDFGDDWLRSAQRGANAKSIGVLGISTESPETKRIDLLMDFGHPDLAKFDATNTVSFATHTGADADLILPLAAYSEVAGTLINEDGIEQACQKAVYRNEPIPSVIEWVELLEGGKA